MAFLIDMAPNTNAGVKLEKAYKKRNSSFHNYIDNIKKNMKVDIYSLINVTLIKNPHNTSFPKKFFLREYNSISKIYLFIKSTIKFYSKQSYYFITYLVGFFIYKVFHKRKKIDLNNFILIDIFCLIDNIIVDNKFNENYFSNLYEVLDKCNKEYIFLPRLYGIQKNPFKLIKFFKIINQDKRNFLFEFEILSCMDFLSIFFMLLKYPFKTLRLLQIEKSNDDRLFNNELIKDISNLSFDAFSRYIVGKNISKTNISKVYSWSEFQVIERSFNYGVRSNNDNIKLYGCQLYLNYNSYFNTSVDDIDFIQKTSYHDVLVNSKYYLLDRNLVHYKVGVSLRYKNVFLFNKIIIPKNIVLIGTFFKETKYMLDFVENFDLILFKNHPIVDIKNFGQLNENIILVNDNIYKLFENASIIISTSSGTSVEAVACGVSVIIIASQDNLTANPLVDFGKGKIWDIAFSKDDVKILYNNLIDYRKNNAEEIKEIASWYKDNFFIEPTEENIIKTFELNKG